MTTDTPDLQERLATLRAGYFAQRRADRQRMREMFDRESREQDKAREEMLQWLRPAEPFEYSAWVKLFMEAGGVPTHFYGHPMSDTWVALCDMTATPLYGASSWDRRRGRNRAYQPVCHPPEPRPLQEVSRPGPPVADLHSRVLRHRGGVVA